MLTNISKFSNSAGLSTDVNETHTIAQVEHTFVNHVRRTTKIFTRTLVRTIRSFRAITCPARTTLGKRGNRLSLRTSFEITRWQFGNEQSRTQLDKAQNAEKNPTLVARSYCPGELAEGCRCQCSRLVFPISGGARLSPSAWEMTGPARNSHFSKWF